MLAFNVLALGVDQTSGSDAFAMRCKRLAHVFKVDLDKFVWPLGQLLPNARNRHMQHKTSIVTAWKHTIEDTQRTTRRQQSYPIDAVIVPLVAYAGWAMPASGVEQNFSIRNWIDAPRRQCSAYTELNLLTITTHTRPEEKHFFFFLRRPVKCRNAILVYVELQREGCVAIAPN